MKTVGNLDGLRRTTRGPLREASAAIAAHHANAGIPLEPGGEGVRLAIGQQIKHMVPFEVDQDRAVATSAQEAPIVDAHDTGCRRRWQRRLADLAEQRVRAGRAGSGEPQGTQQARAGLAS